LRAEIPPPARRRHLGRDRRHLRERLHARALAPAREQALRHAARPARLPRRGARLAVRRSRDRLGAHARDGARASALRSGLDRAARRPLDRDDLPAGPRAARDGAGVPAARLMTPATVESGGADPSEVLPAVAGRRGPADAFKPQQTIGVTQMIRLGMLSPEDPTTSWPR